MMDVCTFIVLKILTPFTAIIKLRRVNQDHKTSHKGLFYFLLGFIHNLKAE